MVYYRARQIGKVRDQLEEGHRLAMHQMHRVKEEEHKLGIVGTTQTRVQLIRLGIMQSGTNIYREHLKQSSHSITMSIRALEE